ncbi:MAG: cell division protein FtsQ/DivIB [Pseudomonadota bacterium]
MRPLSRLLSSQSERPDPAPSLLAYRLHRLWLSPRIRFAARVVLPVAVAVTGAFYALSRPEIGLWIEAQVLDVRRQIEERPEFRVTLMTIDGASAEVDQEVRLALPLDFPVTSFDLDLDDMRDRLEQIDAVASARVQIRSGGILSIEIEERVPALVWRGPEGLVLIDGDGRRVRDVERRVDRADLPLVVGLGANLAAAEVLDLHRAASPLRERLRGFVFVGERRWDVVLDRDQRILLPEVGALAALERVIDLQRTPELRLLDRDVAAVDMRLADRPTVRLAQINPEYIEFLKTLEAEAATQ